MRSSDWSSDVCSSDRIDVDQARMIWAAAKHLDFLCDWGVGIEQTRFSLRECKAFIESQKNAAKEDKKLFLSRREILIMKDVAVHLDRLALMKEADSHSSNRRRKR